MCRSDTHLLRQQCWQESSSSTHHDQESQQASQAWLQVSVSIPGCQTPNHFLHTIIYQQRNLSPFTLLLIGILSVALFQHHLPPSTLQATLAKEGREDVEG